MNHDPSRTDVSRRQFLNAAGGIALAGALAPRVFAAPKPDSPAETAVQRLYQTLTDDQKKTICFPFRHELRQKINPNWHVTKPEIGDDFYSVEQRALIGEVVKNITSPDGYERLLKQMDEDAGGIAFYSIAIFGKPGEGKFEWEMTGRHLTMRADGNSVAGAAFGGPIVYGHGEEDPAQNLFHYQTQQANEVFQALDAGHAEQALLQKPPAESAVLTQGPNGTFPGISVSELSSDQQELVSKTLEVLLAPYRQADIKEAMAILKRAGGVEKLSMAFYKAGDLNDDQVWDIWRIEGPSFASHFRGAPHVHAYINVGRPLKSKA